MLPTPTTVVASIRKVLTGPRRPRAARRNTSPGEALGQRLDAEVGEVPVVGDRVGGEGEGHPEAPGVPEAELAAGGEVQGEVLVGLRLRLAGRQGQPAAHPQVDRQGRAPSGSIHLHQQVLRPPVERLDPAPGQALHQGLSIQRLPERRRAHLDPLHRVAHQQRLQAAAQDFDLGELRHGGGIVLRTGCAPPRGVVCSGRE